MKLDKNYKVRVTPEQSRKIQELLFKLGGGWFGCPEQFIVQYTERPCFYVSSDGRIHANHSEAYFNYASCYSDCTEIHADDLIALLTDLSKSAENPLQGVELTPDFEAVEPVLVDNCHVNTQDIGADILDTNADIKDKPKFKVGDRVYCAGFSVLFKVLKVENTNGVLLEHCAFVGGMYADAKHVCHATQENYERLQATFTDIEFEQPSTQADIDNDAVDKLAQAMKDKLTKKREEGYGGWDKPHCTNGNLSDLLRIHVKKGDPVDVANFCAFLFSRGSEILQNPF